MRERNEVNRRSLIASLISLPFASTEAKKKKVRHGRNRWPDVTVYDHTGWPEVQEIVDEFNKIMPTRGPKLNVVRLEVGCDDVTVCGGLKHDWAAGLAFLGNVPGNGQIQVSDTDDPGYRLGLICHEMMHILTQIPDGYTRYDDGTVVWHHPGVDSCVWNTHPFPGEFDRQKLKETFGGKRPLTKKKRRKSA